MANTRVSDLAAGGAFADTDIVPVVETAGVGPVKKTLAQLAEWSQDLMNSTLVSGANFTFTYNDVAGTITGDYTGAAPPASTDDLPEGVTNLYFTNERAQDAVGAMVDGTLVYVDGTPLLTRAALTGDVTAAQGSNATSIANGAVTYAKIQSVTAARLLGRGSAAGSGAPQELTVGGGVEFTGAGGIQRSALTGDVTATAGSNATTIANDAVTFAKMQNSAAGFSVIGKPNTGAGDFAEIGAAADGVLRRSGSGDLAFGSLVTNNIGDDQVTNAKLANMAESTIKGRAASAGTGDPTDLTPAQVAAMLPLATGTYTPTCTVIQNITGSITPGTWTYFRFSTFVFVSGTFTGTWDGSGEARFRATLPIASNFAATADCAGVMALSDQPGRIFADATNDEAIVAWTPVAASAAAHVIMFSYTII